MDAENHPPEPWTIDGRGILCDATGKPVYRAQRPQEEFRGAKERTIACVNACERFKNEDLEEGVIEEMLAVCELADGIETAPSVTAGPKLNELAARVLARLQPKPVTPTRNSSPERETRHL